MAIDVPAPAAGEMGLPSGHSTRSWDHRSSTDVYPARTSLEMEERGATAIAFELGATDKRDAVPRGGSPLVPKRIRPGITCLEATVHNYLGRHSTRGFHAADVRGVRVHSAR